MGKDNLIVTEIIFSKMLNGVRHCEQQRSNL